MVIGLLMSLWAIATPIGAAPDEPAHLIKAASVVRGEFIGDRGSFGHIVDVPRYVSHTHAQTCYAFDGREEADCAPEVPAPTDEIVKGSTTAGLYNPLYYLLSGWPSLLFGDSTGIYGMRLASAVVVSGFLALAFGLVWSWRRRIFPLIGLAVATTPMVLFLGGTVNPNALEITATLAAFTGMLTIIRERHLPIGPSAAIVLAGAAVAGNMRGLSILWLVVALLVPLVLLRLDELMTLLRRRAVLLVIAGVAIAFIAAAAWLLGTNSLGAAVDDPLTEMIAPGVGAPWYYGAWWTFQATIDYLQGAVGIFGWLDTPSPLFVFGVWATLMGGLLLLSAALLKGRALIFAVLLVGATVALPPLMQAVYITGGGIIWQGRYILPVLVCAALGVATVLSDVLPAAGSPLRRLFVTVTVVWAAAQLHAFATALRRYSVGLDASWADMFTAADWVPPGGLWPSLLGFAVVLAGGVAWVIAASRPRALTD
ncbi:DUF2142 domain-containing protein [Salinibacterium sp. dk2585]|uniref:DUF2142 domain-containing protein n=1 Tax=unclassified Salinibacterium TaxID=2632331 RepID=UPI0011C25521|nr:MULTISPECIES: DUF2142 domain-containing protein [unclassified Salinibacterium]QEE60853.1 DUF2142 domain-containing protein [Salinibacterium sp. dk2585]TXK55925.1 DUF2142 domain-containing protein [Salinibacterium sp. dk5596]